MTALTWPEIKRRLRKIRRYTAYERGYFADLHDDQNAHECDLWIEALDAILSIEALDPKEKSPDGLG